MIALATDCLLFKLSTGEALPLSADMVSVELLDDTTRWFEPEFVNQAAKAVFHYFKYELGRQIVSVCEFAEALQKVLEDFRMSPHLDSSPRAARVDCDLLGIARESGVGGELFFFPRLRDELRLQLRMSPQLLRFRGLRGCVMHLTRARHWSPRCRNLEEQIVGFLRQCLGLETHLGDVALLVD